MGKLVVNSWCGSEEVTLSRRTYADGTAAIQLWCEDGPFATLTRDFGLGKKGKKGRERFGFVDTNNCPWAAEFIKKYELGTYTGLSRQSGF